MKLFKLFVFSFALLFAIPQINAQTNQKVRERQENKVDTLYSMEEKANIHLWAFNEVQKMHLNDDKEDEYFRIVFKYTYRISRLNDKDQDYTNEQRKVEFDKLISQMDAELKEILDEKQFMMHKDYFKKLEKSIYDRYGWVWDKD